MTVYIKKVSTRDQRFKNRMTTIVGFASGRAHVTNIAVPDAEVLCNSCNRNIHRELEETFGWLVYLSKTALQANIPYDVYCESCVKRLFPKAVVVE